MEISIRQMLEADLQDAGMTQKHLAEQLDITQQALSAWLTRNHIPRTRTAKLKQILGSQSRLIRHLEQEAKAIEKALDDGPFLFEKSHQYDSEKELRSRSTRNELIRLISAELDYSTAKGYLSFDGHTRRYDYASNNLIINVYREHQDPQKRSMSLSRLMLSKKMIDLLVAKKNRPEAKTILIYVSDNLEEKEIERIEWESKQLELDFEKYLTLYDVAERLIDEETQHFDFKEAEINLFD